MNVLMTLEMAAECHPERVAVTCGEHSIRYGEMLEAARRAGAKIRASGCRYVGILDINSIAAPVALYAAACAGLPYVPMNYRLTKPEIQALLTRIAPAWLIVDPVLLEGVEIPSGFTVVDRESFLHHALDANVQADDPVPAEPDAVAVQLFTSGTTGAPKAAVLRHENLMSYILGTVEFGAAQDDDATLVAVPPYHIAGISAILSSTYACRRMVQLANFDGRGWLDACAQERVTNAFVVPTMLARVIEYVDTAGVDAVLPALRALAYGGGKMPAPVIERAMQLWPKVDFTNAYGLTETSSTIALLDPEGHREGFFSVDPEVRKRLHSVGRPIDTVEIEIRDGDGKALSVGELGDVFVRGGQVSGEYLGIGCLLDAEGWFPTRDRGYVDKYGFLYLDGRADDVIVRGGENISPGEIEDVLRQHPAIADVAVVAVPDTEWGETVGAAVVMNDGANVSDAELREWVRARLRSSRVPTVISFRQQLPYNEMGKILRRVLRDELSPST